MSYKDFQAGILGLLGEHGIKSKVFFDYDKDLQRYEARIPEHGITVFGRPKGLSMTVKFGSGHQAVVKASGF